MTASARLSLRISAALLLGGLAPAAFGAEPARAPGPTVATPGPPTVAALPSEEECAAYGRSLAVLFNAGRLEEIFRQLNKVALADRVGIGLGFSDAEARDFQAGVLRTLPASLQKEFAAFTSARFLRVQNIAGERRALLRLLNEQGGVNYGAFICEKRENVPVYWSDVSLYSTGETVSSSSRRSVLPVIAQAKKGLLQKLTGGESAYVASFKTIHQIAQLSRQGKIVEAWATCETLPDEVKQDRTVLTYRLRLAQSLDETKYLRVIADWETAFPGDATLDLISIDGNALRKNYSGALRHIDALDRRIGGDPYLEVMAANVHILTERYDEARTHARAALAAEPDLASAFDVLLALSLRAKDYAEIVKLLEESRTARPRVGLDNIVAGEEYGEFRLSKDYLDWSAAQKKTAAEKSVP